VEAGLLSELSHRRDQANVRAAGRALRSRHFHNALRSRAAAVFLRAVVAYALAARNLDLFGDGLVAGNLFLNGLDKPVFRAVVGAHFFGDNIIATGFDLFGLGAVARAGCRHAEHGTAGRKAQRKGGECDKAKEFFHRFVFKIFQKRQQQEAAARAVTVTIVRVAMR